MIDPTVGLVNNENWMVKTHKEKLLESLDYGISGNPSRVVMCFNLELIIVWSINSYFNWSDSGARVKTNDEEITDICST